MRSDLRFFGIGRGFTTGYHLEHRRLPLGLSTVLVTLVIAARSRPEKGRRPPAPTGSRQYLKTLSVGRRASIMRVPMVRQPCHGGRWETTRYALDSNARTFPFCLIWAVVNTSPAVAAAITAATTPRSSMRTGKSAP
jgi:hypothetical protein